MRKSKHHSDQPPRMWGEKQIHQSNSGSAQLHDDVIHHRPRQFVGNLHHHLGSPLKIWQKKQLLQSRSRGNRNSRYSNGDWDDKVWKHRTG